MLKVIDLTKEYGSRTLFANVTFSLNPEERVGLVGRNGSGKSTLFRLILGEEHPNSGTIAIPRDYRVGHLAQHLTFNQESILKEVCLGLPEEERDQEYRGEIILAGLGFSEADMHQPPHLFSGGFQIRLNLAKLLLSEPNLLLLDEPTNYLDIVSMRWLTSFLRAWRNELMVISHDRLFMDSITTHTMLIHRGAIRKIAGGTEKLYSQVLQDEEIYEKTRVNEDKKRRELELFVNRFRAQASKATLVQSKIKALERMGQKQELLEEDTIDFRFCEAPFPGKQILEVKDLFFSYPDGPNLIENFSLTVGPRDRIGIVGKNGKGKSTLLRLFNAELVPSQGKIVRNQNAQIGYFGQTNIARLSPHLSVEQEIESANPRLHRTKVRAICGTMMFSGDDALKRISVLSGGEKSRVLLGRLLALPTNFLLLDEPTNHLDMESIEALIDSLKTYEGAVAIVTHSELLLRELVTRLIIFQGNTPKLFDHDYSYFLEKEGWGDEEEMSSSGSSSAANNRTSNPRTRENSNPGKVLKQLERKITKLEEKIYRLEAEMHTTEAQLSAASLARDVPKITSLSIQLSEQKAAIELHFSELESVSADYQERKPGS